MIMANRPIFWEKRKSKGNCCTSQKGYVELWQWCQWCRCCQWCQWWQCLQKTVMMAMMEDRPIFREKRKSEGNCCTSQKNRVKDGAHRQNFTESHLIDHILRSWDHVLRRSAKILVDVNPKQLYDIDYRKFWVWEPLESIRQNIGMIAVWNIQCYPNLFPFSSEYISHIL